MINEDKLETLLFCIISGIEEAKGFSTEEGEEMRVLITKSIIEEK